MDCFTRQFISFIGLIIFISSISYAADFSSDSFISRDAGSVGAGGRQSSTNFININTVGTPVLGGEQSSASFLNQVGNLFFNPARPGTLSVSSRVSANSTDPIGRSDFILSYPDADPNGKLFMACYGLSQVDVGTNCTGGATRAFTEETSHTFTALKRNTVYYFRVYPIFGYNVSGDPLIGPTPTNIVSGAHNEFSGGGGGGSGGGGGGGSFGAQPQTTTEAPVAPAAEQPINSSESIVTAPTSETFAEPVNQVNPINFIRRIGEALGLAPAAPVDRLSAPLLASPKIPEVAPPALAGKLPVVPDAALEQMVFGGLPKEITFLLKQFPDLKKTFSEIGVEQVSDIVKLGKAKFSLPNISDLKEVSLPSGVLIANLSKAQVQKIPAEVLFVRTPEEHVDVNTVLVFDRQGKPQQLVNVTAGAEFTLVVRPDKPAARVDGYILHNQRELTRVPRLPMRSLAASLVLGATSLGEPATTSVDKKLLVAEFQYQEQKNGVFKANVAMPKARGEFDIATVITYKDKRLPAKNIDMVAVVDPQGYVFYQTRQGKARIESAKVTLYQCPPSRHSEGGGHLSKSSSSKPNVSECVLWDAARYSQRNPQTTDENGEYSFLTPPGKYYITVEARGYELYQSDPFVIGDENFVRHNIELQKKSFFRKIFGL